MNILVTGGAGYVGSHTCKILKQSGFSPIVLDNFINGHQWAVKWGPYFKINLNETDKIAKLLHEEKISAVVHFAAFAYVGESVQEPLKYYENNFVGTLSLLKAMQMANVDKIVFSSSCATYGLPVKTPIEEGSLQEPINPYGRTKLMVEKVLQDLAHVGRMNSISLRYFNAAGADFECEIGEVHSPETHLIPLAIAATYNNECELTVLGTDYPTPDGTCIRDYIHVTDLASAHVAALRLLVAPNENQVPKELVTNAKKWRAYNLGTGKGYSVKEVLSTLEEVTGRKVKAKYGERRLGDPPELVASAGLAQKELGWKPVHSSLETILKDAVRWYEKHNLMILVYQAYGREDVLRQTLFSIISLLSVIDEKSPICVWIYTDNAKMYADYFGDLVGGDKPRIRIFGVTSQDIQKWRGAINFVHRVKVEILIDAAARSTGSIFYADGDTFYRQDPTTLFAQVNDENSLMHILENRIEAGRDPLSKKIARFVKKNTFYFSAIEGQNNNTGVESVQITLETEMWNAGVLGISQKNKALLPRVLALTDKMHALYPKHIMEQLAFSYYLQTYSKIFAGNEIIGHYWEQKELYQLAIDDFLVRNKNWSSAQADYANFPWPPILPLTLKSKNESKFSRLLARFYR